MKLVLALAALIPLTWSCLPKTKSAAAPAAIGVATTPEAAHAATVRMGSCSATKIGSKRFLTARHCVRDHGWAKGSSISLLAGGLAGNPDATVVQVADAASHDTLDIAVLDFVEETANIPSASLFVGEVPQSQKVTMAGYGCRGAWISEGKIMPSVSGGDSLQTVEGTLSPEGSAPGMDITRFLYIKSTSERVMGDVKITGPALCPGDSGGSLWKKHDGKWFVWGVASTIHPVSLLSTFVRVDGQAADGISAWVQGE